MTQSTKLVYIMSTVISLLQENKGELRSIVCLLHTDSIKFARNIKVSVKENEVSTEKNSSCASIFATKASYISN